MVSDNQLRDSSLGNRLRGNVKCINLKEVSILRQGLLSHSEDPVFKEHPYLGVPYPPEFDSSNKYICVCSSVFCVLS